MINHQKQSSSQIHACHEMTRCICEKGQIQQKIIYKKSEFAPIQINVISKNVYRNWDFFLQNQDIFAFQNNTFEK